MQFVQPLINLLSQALIQLQIYTGNLGLSILLFTLIIRTLILPLSLPTFASQKKMRAMQPELNNLKKKHKGDNKALQTAQLELYKKYNVNPLAGCLPQLLQFAVLFLLYRVLINFLSQGHINGVAVNAHFLWLNLSKTDNTFILPILAGVTQLILTVMILPGGEVPDVVPNQTKDKKLKELNDKEEKTADMAEMMQQQMLLMPLITAFFATRFPSGLALYWVATTVYSIVQQYFLAGPGGLFTYTQRAMDFIKNRVSRR